METNIKKQEIVPVTDEPRKQQSLTSADLVDKSTARDDTVISLAELTAEELANASLGQIAPGSEKSTGYRTLIDPTLVSPRGYILESIIGRGGMSVVYRARHLLLNKPMAVKMLHSHMAADERALKRFQQEARSVSSLEHPGIISIHDFGITDGQNVPYLCMDLANGQSLFELLRDGPLEAKRALQICLQVCAALTHAHEMGIVHRDIKPSNVLLINEGTDKEQIKVVDFGIAKVLEASDNRGHEMTRTGESVGSPPYMSPEQCQGLALDARSDVYSLGCLLYELITGEAPLRGASAYETIHRQMHDLPESVSAHRADLRNAAALDALILKSIAKNPSQRFQSMREFGEAIDAVLPLVDKKPDAVTYLRLRSQVMKAQFYNRPLVALGTCAFILLVPAIVAWNLHVNEQQLAKQANGGLPAPESQAMMAADCLLAEGTRELEQHQYSAAEKSFLRCLDAASPLGMISKQYRHALDKLAEVYDAENKPSQADSMRAKSSQLEKFMVVLGDANDNSRRITELEAQHLTKPHDKAINDELGRLMNSQAWLYLRNHDLKQSRQIAGDALAFNRSVSGPQSNNAIDSLVLLADVEARLDIGEHPEAKIQKAMALAESKLGRNCWQAVQCKLSMADYYGCQLAKNALLGNPAEARSDSRESLKWCNEAIDSARHYYHGDSPWLAEGYRCLAGAYNLAGIYLGEKHWNEAEAAERHALNMQTKLCGTESFSTAIAYSLLGEIHTNMGRSLSGDASTALFKEADSELGHSITLFEKNELGESLRLAQALIRRGFVRECLGDYPGAQKYYRRCFDIARRWGKECDFAKSSYQDLMRVFAKQGKTAEASALMAEVQVDQLARKDKAHTGLNQKPQSWIFHDEGTPNPNW